MKMWFSPVHGLTIALVLASPIVVSARDDEDPQDEQREAGSQEGSGGAKGLEGLWDARVTIHDCETGAVIARPRARNMFNRGGTLNEVNARASAVPRGPGFGTWRKENGQSYSSVFWFSRFNADGSFAATQKVTRSIELAGEGNQFTATASFELFDANDTLFQTGCATETATRLE
jgi:hypothetical protein